MLNKIALGGFLALACVSIQAAPLSFETKTVKAQACFMDKNKTKKCHEKIVTYPITGDKYLDEMVKNLFGEIYSGKLPTKESVKAEIEAWQRNLNLDELAQQLNLVADKCAIQYWEESTLKLAGFTPNYAFFSTEDSTNSCKGRERYTSGIFRMPRHKANPKHIDFEDFFVSNQPVDKSVEKMIHLQKEALVKYLQTEHKISEKEARKIANRPGFATGTAEFLPDKNSMVFMLDAEPEKIKLAIPFSDLEGIVKPEFLQELKQYTPRPEKH